MGGAERWVRSHIPSLAGSVAVVTGATSGIGRECARLLALAGAEVVVGCRDVGRAPAEGEAHELDLSDLASVRSFAAEVRAAHPHVDVLVNNAGIMAVRFEYTVDGFERQLGVNHLGPFLLTAELLPALRAAPAARVVAVSSLYARRGAIRLDDLMGERWYDPWAAYAQSKLADLCFATELARRDLGVASLAAHPGYAATRLVANGPGGWAGPASRLTYSAGGLVAQSAAAGALPVLAAAASPLAGDGEYWAPRFALRGRPRRIRPPAAARDEALCAALWDRSCELTGALWPG